MDCGVHTQTAQMATAFRISATILIPVDPYLFICYSFKITELPSLLTACYRFLLDQSIVFLVMAPEDFVTVCHRCLILDLIICHFNLSHTFTYYFFQDPFFRIQSVVSYFKVLSLKFCIHFSFLQSCYLTHECYIFTFS
jgi:hypothetical protein